MNENETNIDEFIDNQRKLHVELSNLIRDGLNSNEKYSNSNEIMRDKLCGSILCKLSDNKRLKNILTYNTIKLNSNSILNLLKFGNNI